MFALNGTNNSYIILDVPQSSSDQESLLCCRACLSTEDRLFNIHDFKLADAFSHASGSLAVKDQLPQYLCSFCRGVVLKCASFRDMCARTQQQLMTELLRGQLNTESIRRINKTTDQWFKLTLTEVETIDCPPSITKTEAADDIQVLRMTLEQDTHMIDTLPVELMKNEPNIDIVDINSILRKTDNNNTFADKLDKSKDILHVEGKHIKKEGRKIQTTITKRGTKKDKTDTYSNIKSESAFNNDIVVDFSSLKSEPNCIYNVDQNKNVCDDSNSQEDVPIIGIKDEHKINNASDKKNNNSLVKTKKRNIKERETNVVKKRKETAREIKRERQEIDKMARNKSFESDYSVLIVFQSKEEQLAEVNARKETPNYKESDYKCQECYKGYDDKVAYENHMLRHNPSAGSYVCEFCKLRFPKNHLRLSHLDKHKMKIICTMCGFVSRTKSQARDHHCLHEGKTFDCPHCGKGFIKRTSCLSHTRLKHPALNVTCEQCGEVFVGDVGLRNHKGKMHAEVRNPKNTSCLSHTRLKHPALNVTCEQCGEVFVGDVGLRNHKGKMHAEKIQCTKCSAKFVSLAALDRHTDTAGEHADLRPCEQCGENCASETALQEHVREKHPRNHRCEECSLAFPSAEAYSTHVARTHLQRRKPDSGRQSAPKRKRAVLLALARAAGSSHMCEQCGRIYPSGPLLKIHQRTHDEVKRYSCDHCSKAFTQKVTLICHLRSHSGEKPFKCPSCPLAFNQQGNFNRHNKTAHLGIRASYACSICGSSTSTKSSLRVHVASKHGGRGWPKSRRRTRHEHSTK